MPEPKLPGPGHPIAIRPATGILRAVFEGRVVARSGRALLLKEAGLPEVAYFPREDADMNVLRRSARSSYCPYKGHASYFSIGAAGSAAGEDAVWSYEDPFPAVAEIRGLLAFYPDRVTVQPA